MLCAFEWEKIARCGHREWVSEGGEHGGYLGAIDDVCRRVGRRVARKITNLDGAHSAPMGRTAAAAAAR